MDEKQKISIEDFSEKDLLKSYIDQKIMNPVVLYLAREEIKKIFRECEINLKDVSVHGYLSGGMTEKLNSLSLSIIGNKNLKRLKKSLEEKFPHSEINFFPSAFELILLENIFQVGENILSTTKNIYVESNKLSSDIANILDLVGRPSSVEDKKKDFYNKRVQAREKLKDLICQNKIKNEDHEILFYLAKIYDEKDFCIIKLSLEILCTYLGTEKIFNIFSMANNWNIFEACEKGYTEIVKRIVDKNPKAVHEKNKYSTTPLQKLLDKNEIEIELFEYLVESDSNIDFMFSNKDDIFSKNKEIWKKISLEDFLENSINNKSDESYRYNSRFKGLKPIQIAIYLLDQNSIKKILEYSTEQQNYMRYGFYKGDNIFYIALYGALALLKSKKFSNSKDGSEIDQKLALVFNECKIFHANNIISYCDLLEDNDPNYIEKKESDFEESDKEKIEVFPTLIEKIVFLESEVTLKFMISEFGLNTTFKIGPNKGLTLLQFIMRRIAYFAKKDNSELITAVFSSLNESEKKELIKSTVPEKQSNYSLFHFSIVALHIGLIKYFIEQGEDVNAPFPKGTEFEGWLPVHYVVYKMCEDKKFKNIGKDILDFLLEKNANIMKFFPSGKFKGCFALHVLFEHYLDIFELDLPKVQKKSLSKSYNINGQEIEEIDSAKLFWKLLFEQEKFNFDINVYSKQYNFLHFIISSKLKDDKKIYLLKFLIKNNLNILLKTREILPISVLQIIREKLKKGKNIDALFSEEKNNLLEKNTSKEYKESISNKPDQLSEFLMENLEHVNFYKNYEILDFESKEELSENNENEILALPCSLTDEDHDSVVTNPTLLKTLRAIPKFEIFNYVNFSVPRTALHITIIYLAMKIKSKDDEEFKKIVKEVYNDYVLKYILKKENALKINKRLEQIEHDYHEKIHKVLEKRYSFDTRIKKESDKIHLLITEWIESNLLEEDFYKEENSESLLKSMVFSKFMHHEIHDLLYEDLIKEIRKFIEDKNIKKLEYKNNKERVSWTILGGAGSGKSYSLVKRIKDDLKEYVYSDICRINPDTYKELLINFQIIEKFKDNSYQCLEYVHEESSFISKKIQEYLKKYMDDDKAPNILLDTVKPDDKKTQLVSYESATSYIYIANCSVEKAWKRVEERRSRTGRPVPFQVFLKGHKEQSKIVRHINTGEHFVYIFDTTEDGNAVKIASLEAGKEMFIENFQKMLDFVSKQEINLDAKEFNNLYEGNKKDLDIKTKMKFLMEYIEAKITLKFLDSEKKSYAYISSENILTITDFVKFIEHVGDNNDFEIFDAFLDCKNLDIVILNKLAENSNFQQKILVIRNNKIVWCAQDILKNKFDEFFSFLIKKYPEEIKEKQPENKERKNSIDFFKSNFENKNDKKYNFIEFKN